MDDILFITEPWVIGDDAGDFVAIVCEQHARQYATENGLHFEYAGFTAPHESGLYAYVDHFGEIESDTPTACDCGQYLSVNLTSDGEQYLRDNRFPQKVHDYYRIEYAG